HLPERLPQLVDRRHRVEPELRRKVIYALYRLPYGIVHVSRDYIERIDERIERRDELRPHLGPGLSRPRGLHVGHELVDESLGPFGRNPERTERRLEERFPYRREE